MTRRGWKSRNYQFLKYHGDVNAVLRRRIPRRVGRRIAGKVVGRLLGKLFG